MTATRWGLLLGAAAVALVAPRPAQASPNKAVSCVSCHNAPSAIASVTSAIDGTVRSTISVAPGDTFEVDFQFTDIVYDTKRYSGSGPEIAVPAGWGVSAGTQNAPAIPGWNSVWDAANGVGWNNVFAAGTEHPNSPDGYGINYAGTSWDTGNRDAAFDDGSAGDLDGVANRMGADAIISVPSGASAGAYEIVVLGIGHDASNAKGYVAQILTVTVQGTAGETTTLGDGTDPSDATIGPGGPATFVDAFSLVTSGGTDSVSQVSVGLAPGAASSLSLVEITDSAGSTLHGAVSSPGADALAVTLSQPLQVTTSPTEYRIRVTPKTHASMSGPPGATHAVTATVTGVTCSNGVSGSDPNSATVTIDDESTAQVVWGSVTPGDGQVELAWTNPADGDYATTLIVRDTAPIADAPAEGGGYAGPGTEVYSGAGAAMVDSGLNNGTGYYYGAFAQDARGNWSVGASVGPVTPASVGGDTDAPCAPAGLHVYQRDSSSVSIRFTAPFGDCALANGDPDRYMVRYAFAGLDAASWDAARIWDDAWPATVAAGGLESITLSGLDSNQRYFIQVRAVDLENNVGPLAELQSASANATWTHLHLGWNMVGTENLLGGGETCQEVFGFASCFAWETTGSGDWDGAYVDLAATGAVIPGRGYWLSVGTPGIDLTPPADSTATTGEVSVTLQPGMNLVANPHDLAVAVADATVTRNGTLTRTYAEAVAAGWVLPAVYAYDGANYLPQPVTGLPGGLLHPRKAVWLKLAVEDGQSYSITIPDPTP